jgi:hypothetical protein
VSKEVHGNWVKAMFRVMEKTARPNKGKKVFDRPYRTMRVFSWLLLERLNARCF